MTSRLWSCNKRKRAIDAWYKYVYIGTADGHLYIGLRTSFTQNLNSPTTKYNI